jgi:hypothetical protein
MRQSIGYYSDNMSTMATMPVLNVNDGKNSTNERLVAHIRGRIKNKCETTEQEKVKREPFSFVSGTGKWDVAPEEFSRRIEANIRPIARSEREADMLIDAIFARIEFPAGESGGDHHTLYFQDYNVRTSAAIAFSANFPELRELLRTQHIRDRIKDKCEATEQEKIGREGASYFMHGTGSWDISSDEFSRRIEANLLPVARSEQEANVLIDAIFAKIEFTPGADSCGDHHAGYWQEYNISTRAAIEFSANIPELQKLLRTQ